MRDEDRLGWRRLERGSQLYVAGVIAVGAIWVAARFPLTLPNPILFIALMAASCVTSVWKVTLPLPAGSDSTLSVSYAANLAALLLLGPRLAMVVAAAGAWTQCTVAARRPYPLYRTVFSTAAAVITIHATGLTYGWLGGEIVPLALADLSKPLLGAIATYFVVNTGLVAGAIALSAGQPLWTVWHDDFLWSAPAFLFAGAAGAATAVVLERGWWAEAVLLYAPVYLTYRTYRIFLGRLEDQRRHAAEAHRLNEETLEALFQAKRAEQALAREKEHLAVTLRSVGDGVITTNLEGDVLLMNDVAQRLTGRTHDEAIGMPLATVFRSFDPETRARRDLNVAELARTNASRTCCTVLVAKDLTEHPIEEIAAPLRDGSGRTIGVVLAFRDISDALKVQAEHARASKFASLGLLAGGIAGDFNNILMTIMGNVAMARATGRGTGPADHALADAEQACVGARHLTWRLLAFANGGVPLRETIAMSSVLSESIKLALRGSSLTCRVNVPPDLWNVQADKGLLIEALKNVLTNAHEAMSRGGVIEIQALNVAEPVDRWEHALRVQAGHYVRVSVADRGIGIPSEHLARIFDPYFTTKPKGSGLGLATMHSIIKGHGGFVSVDSAPGRGTTIHLNFPVSPARVQHHEVECNVPAATGKPRVLVMDDEACNRILSANMLEFLGYEVALADSGRLAIERFARAQRAGSPFHVVMLDLMVAGGMGGREAIHELAAIDPAVRAILVSGHVRDEAMAHFWKYGFKAVLAKPFNLQDLSRTIDHVIGASGCRVH